MRYASDAPWWYNERALISLLAGAIWRTGNEAFEEYSEYKRHKKRLSSGRIDLWFCVGAKEFWAEAKAAEIRITRNASQVEIIEQIVEETRRDADRLSPDGYTKRLAITFLSPYLRPCKRPQMEDRINWLIERARLVDHDAIAWIFPNLYRLPKFNNWVSPGIVCLIKEVKRRRRT